MRTLTDDVTFRVMHVTDSVFQVYISIQRERSVMQAILDSGTGQHRWQVAGLLTNTSAFFVCHYLPTGLKNSL